MFNEFNNKLDLSKQINYDEFEKNLQTWFLDVEQIKELNGDFILENKDRLKFKIGKWKQTNKNEWGVDYIYLYVFVFKNITSEIANNLRYGQLHIPYVIVLKESTTKDYNHWINGSILARKNFHAPKSFKGIINFISKKFPQFIKQQ